MSYDGVMYYVMQQTILSQQGRDDSMHNNTCILRDFYACFNVCSYINVSPLILWGENLFECKYTMCL